MLFTRMTWILSILVLLYGAVSIALSFAISADLLSDNIAILSRYWPTKSPADLFDRGVVAIVLALPLGTVAEISRALQR